MIKEDLERRIEKIDLALISSQKYFERQSEANAALHVSDRVLYSPLVAVLEEARNDLKALKAEIETNE